MNSVPASDEDVCMQALWLVLIALVIAVNLRLIASAVLAYRGIWTHQAQSRGSSRMPSTLSRV